MIEVHVLVLKVLIHFKSTITNMHINALMLICMFVFMISGIRHYNHYPECDKNLYLMVSLSNMSTAVNHGCEARIIQ